MKPGNPEITGFTGFDPQPDHCKAGIHNSRSNHDLPGFRVTGSSFRPPPTHHWSSRSIRRKEQH